MSRKMPCRCREPNSTTRSSDEVIEPSRFTVYCASKELIDHGSSAAADRTACESLVTTSMRQAAATANMKSRPRCGPGRVSSLAADIKAALLYDQPPAGNSDQDSASLGSSLSRSFVAILMAS